MPEITYVPLPSLDDVFIERHRISKSIRKWLLISLGIVLYVYPLIYTIKHQVLYQENTPASYARTYTGQTTWKQFWWNTRYSPHNHNESDHLWAKINPAHGFIAVDRKLAADNHWPVSMWPPNDRTKAVYLLEAYHQLHCLRIIRQAFWEAAEKRPYTYQDSLKHMEHCFDTLRQAIQCMADNTPLYTFGNFTAGDGQVHRCADWDELRDFATTNTACYRDSVMGIPLGEHFGFCDDGKDGLEGAF